MSPIILPKKIWSTTGSWEFYFWQRKYKNLLHPSAALEIEHFHLFDFESISPSSSFNFSVESICCQLDLCTTRPDVYFDFSCFENSNIGWFIRSKQKFPAVSNLFLRPVLCRQFFDIFFLPPEVGRRTLLFQLFGGKQRRDNNQTANDESFLIDRKVQ